MNIKKILNMSICKLDFPKSYFNFKHAILRYSYSWCSVKFQQRAKDQTVYDWSVTEELKVVGNHIKQTPINKTIIKVKHESLQYYTISYMQCTYDSRDKPIQILCNS